MFGGPKRKEYKMKKGKFVYYREDDMWVGWLEEKLKDIYQELTGGRIFQ
jgi:hypothetical protein